MAERKSRLGGDFSGRVALVVGAGTGIGREAACLFALGGAKVVVASRSENACRETCELIRDNGGDAVLHVGDATSEDVVRAMVDFAIVSYGRLDAAFNNVGDPGPIADLPEVDLEDFVECQRRNTTSCFLAMKYEIPAKLQGGGGSIVNMSSGAGLIGQPLMSAYVAAKHAVHGLTKTVALEYADRGIRANAICPGATDTPMFRRSMAPLGISLADLPEAMLSPMGRIGEAVEQAEAAVWLCSPRASFVTGQIMSIDGGMLAGNRRSKLPAMSRTSSHSSASAPASSHRA